MAWQDRAYNQESSAGRGGGGPRIGLPVPTPLAGTLIAVCVVIFIIERGVFGASLAGITSFGVFSYADGLAWIQPWRWITYQYLHGSFGHLIWNMISIYFLVPMIQGIWGWKKTLAFYTAGGIASCVTFGLMCMVMGTHSFLIGASGCVLAIIGAVAYLSPQTQIMAMMMIPVSMRGLAILYAIVYSLTVLVDKDFSDAAHLGGLAFGVIAPYVITTFLNPTSQKWRTQQSNRARRIEREEQGQIDRVLQKVHDSGMNSLTRQERKALARATERQRQADLAKAARIR